MGMKFDAEKFKDQQVGKSGKTVGSMTQSQCEEVIILVKKNLGIEPESPDDFNLTMALIAGLRQSGGTNRNAGSNVAYTLKGHTLNAQKFLRFCQAVVKGGTARQFARAMYNEIHEFTEALEEGDLARQMRLDLPRLTKKEAVWCSNFQSENPNCPEIDRSWLVSNRKSRFN